MFGLEKQLQTISTPAYFLDVESQEILAVNAQFARLMGYDPAELLKMTAAQRRPSEDVAKLKRALQQPPPRGAVEWRYKTRDGTIIYVQLTVRDSMHVDDAAGRHRNVRMVVISKWDPQPLKTSDQLFGES